MALQDTRKPSVSKVRREELAPGPVGRLVDTRRLAELLAYPSANAVRHAHRRGKLSVPLYRVAGRRGLFARMHDVTTLLREGLKQAHSSAPEGASTTEEVS